MDIDPNVPCSVLRIGGNHEHRYCLQYGSNLAVPAPARAGVGGTNCHQKSSRCCRFRLHCDLAAMPCLASRFVTYFIPFYIRILRFRQNLRSSPSTIPYTSFVSKFWSEARNYRNLLRQRNIHRPKLQRSQTPFTRQPHHRCCSLCSRPVLHIDLVEKGMALLAFMSILLPPLYLTSTCTMFTTGVER